MTLAELQRVLRAADPAAVLVSPRILERVIREDNRLPSLSWNLPHWKSYVCDREMLFRHAEQADLEIEPDQVLPDTVILLLRPDAEEMSNLERRPLLLKYWRRLFHSRVHLAFGPRPESGPLTDEALRERMAEIGQTEFEEVRQVLIADKFLPPEADARQTYVEFASVYLELRYFAANLLTNYFPGIRDPDRFDALLSRDLDASALFEQTRLNGAPSPSSHTDVRTDESQEAYWELVRTAQGAALEGNRVKAAILRMKASRIAPAALTLPTRREAEADIADLAGRLAAAFHLSAAEKEDWARHLTLLLDKADQGALTVEAKLLDDLQRACEDHERETYTLDLIEYLMSGGKRPIKRPLPSQRMVRIVRHLDNAVQRLDEVRLSDEHRQHLAGLMGRALSKSIEGLHAKFRPVLTTALEDVGLKPTDPVERVSFEKMVAELLDRITTVGFISFGELRDTISRNQLKLPDLSEPEHFLRGDPLLRLDTRLASLLDGVYRRGELYSRWLEGATSLMFGTLTGRVLTRFVLLPALLAWMSVYLLGFLLSLVPERWSPGLRQASNVLMGPVHDWAEQTKGKREVAADPEAAPHPPPHHDSPHWGWHVGIVGAAAVFALALLENERFRRKCLAGLLRMLEGARRLIWDVPVSLVPLETIQKAIASWPFQLFYWAVFKPGVFCALVAVVRPELFLRWYTAVPIYVGIALVVNSNFGRGASEAVRDGFTQAAVLIRSGLLPGLFRLIVQVFKQVAELIELTLFRVDEWLRFRTGDSHASMVVRTVLGVIWYPVSSLIRFFMLVLIEPMINPLKLPITFLAAKVYYALGPAFGLLPDLRDPPLAGYIGMVPAYVLAFGIINLLPSVGGFLGWEMQENWQLYRSNRGQSMQPVAVGPHGESVRGLLQPGFHSGTVPLLFARLRVAERAATRTRNWSRVRAYRHEVEHVAGSLQKFVEREMVALLLQSRAWRGVRVSAGPVHLATNRVAFEVAHADYPDRAVLIEVRHHHGQLVARLRKTGWLEELGEDQVRVFATCLAALYKRADVDLVREQVLAGLPPPVASLEFTADAVLVRPALHAATVAYRLGTDEGDEHEALRGLVFGRQRLPWAMWVECWRRDQEGAGHPGLPGIADALIPPSPQRPLPSSPFLELPRDVETPTGSLPAVTDT